MSHNSLMNYLTVNFNMVRYYNFSHSEIEDMVVYEKDVYVTMVKESKG